MNDVVTGRVGPVTIVRCSSLSGFADCPRRWAARQLRDEVVEAGFELRTPTRSIGATMGTAVHKGAGLMLAEKAASGVLPPASVSEDAAVESLRHQAQEAEGGILMDRETPALNDGEQQVVRMVRTYRNEVAPEIEPIIVEERLEAQVTPHIVISGQADVIAREPGRVRDLKSGKKVGAHGPQIGGYGLLARTHGLDVTEAGIDFVQRVPLKKPQPPAVKQRVNLASAETAAINVLRHIEAGIKVFREGDLLRNVAPFDPWAWPSNPQSMLCSAKWCEAHSACKRGSPGSFCNDWSGDDEE